MSPRVTVLIPTLDHGPTLRYSVASALGQEGVELEVLIVGDGMPPPAAETAREVAAGDERVRLFEFEKGPRHGEVHRAAVLEREATGEAVLYLADDDLWLPRHAERVLAALAKADLVAASAAAVDASGRVRTLFHELADSRTRQLMLDADYPYNRVPLSAIAHTMRAYRTHTDGWQTTPDGVWTDLHFTRQFLVARGCTVASLDGVSVLTLPSPERREMSAQERARELAAWWGRIEDREQRAALEAELRRAAWQDAVELELTSRRWRLEAHSLQRRAERLEAQAARDEEARRRAEAEVAPLTLRLREIEGSRAWRALERVRSTALWRRAARAIPRRRSASG